MLDILNSLNFIEKKNFIANIFPQDFSKLVVLQLEWREGQAYCSWSGETTLTRSTGFEVSSVVEIGRKFAELNGMNAGEQVFAPPLYNHAIYNRSYADKGRNVSYLRV